MFFTTSVVVLERVYLTLSCAAQPQSVPGTSQEHSRY